MLVQAVEATAPGLDPGVEADSIIMPKTVLFSMGQMECYPKLRQRGVVTIPEEVRDGLDLEEGDQLKLIVEKLD
ncbi:AbrB/MazE/SpoVT family DNA-binding domain-containing protein [Halorubrum amylolyticum]|nr:AbrB/MazE/SpoVT family DNA-binding domain-containing protein [Halorubrum amylolyticum]